MQYSPFSVAGYEYPGWGIAIGWVIATLSIAAIPIGMIHAIVTAEGKTICQVCSHVFTEINQVIAIGWIIAILLRRGCNN